MRLHEQLREAFTVELIMTPREQLYCVAEDERPSPEFTYDLVPVYEKTTGHIVGLWLKQDGQYNYQPLSERWLVSYRTPIRSCIELLSQPPHSLLVVNENRIAGVVSRADLGKIASRAYLYTLFAEAEWLMARLIRSVLSEDQAVGMITENRRKKLLVLHQKKKASDEDIGFVSLMNFSDLLDIIAKCEELRGVLEYLPQDQMKDELECLLHMRNDVAHPVREPRVVQIVEAVCKVERLIERLETTKQR